MKYIEKISKLFNIDEIYIGLILKTIIIISSRKNRYKNNKENKR